MWQPGKISAIVSTLESQETVTKPRVLSPMKGALKWVSSQLPEGHLTMYVYLPGGEVTKPRFAQFFHGSLASLTIRPGKMENQRVISCLQACKEGLDINSLESLGQRIKVRKELPHFQPDCSGPGHPGKLEGSHQVGINEVSAKLLPQEALVAMTGWHFMFGVHACAPEERVPIWSDQTAHLAVSLLTNMK